MTERMALVGDPLPSPEQLVQAFGVFSSAADLLQRSYCTLTEEVHRLRRELEQERDLRTRREALAEVAAILAHEIRNPLGSMELFTGLLADSTLPGAACEWVEQLRSGIRLLTATVNNILEFHAGAETNLQPVELHSVLRSVEALLGPVAEQARVRWENVMCAQELWIQADRQRLQQVFLNLVWNVFRHAAQGGVLRISTSQKTGAALAFVEDEGPGIDPKILGRIFEPGATTRAGGTGLGLAVAKRIVEMHGGAIAVESHPGRGTIFSLRFPALQVSESVQEMAGFAGRLAPDVPTTRTAAAGGRA